MVFLWGARANGWNSWNARDSDNDNNATTTKARTFFFFSQLVQSITRSLFICRVCIFISSFFFCIPYHRLLIEKEWRKKNDATRRKWNRKRAPKLISNKKYIKYKMKRQKKCDINTECRAQSSNCVYLLIESRHRVWH